MGATLRQPAWLAFALLECGAIAVFWLFDAPPFMDFAGHAGVMALRLQHPDSPFLQQHFVLTNEIGGYPLYRFGGDLLARLFGPLTAMRIISTIPVAALPLAMHHARRRLHGDDSPAFVFLALILSFGYMTQMGLTPYLVAFPVVIWALTEWMVVLDKVRAGVPAVAAEVRVAALAATVAMIHSYAFAALVVMMLVTALSARPTWPRLVRLRVLMPAFALLSLTAMLTSSALPPGAVGTPVPFSAQYGSVLDKMGLLTNPTLSTRAGMDLAIGIGIWVLALCGLIVWPTRRTDGSRQLVALRNAAIALFALFIVLPHRVRFFDAVDSRLLPFVLLVALMAIEADTVPLRLRRRLTLVTGAAAAGFVALQLVAMHMFQWEAAGYREVLARIPAERKLLYLPLEADSRVFVSHPFAHYDKLAVVERSVVPSQYSFHHASGIFPTAHNPILRLPRSHVQSSLKRVEWSEYRLADWDYVLIRRFPDAPAPKVPAALKLEMHRGGWWLYRSRGTAAVRAGSARDGSL